MNQPPYPRPGVQVKQEVGSGTEFVEEGEILFEDEHFPSTSAVSANIPSRTNEPASSRYPKSEWWRMKRREKNRRQRKLKRREKWREQWLMLAATLLSDEESKDFQEQKPSTSRVVVHTEESEQNTDSSELEEGEIVSDEELLFEITTDEEPFSDALGSTNDEPLPDASTSKNEESLPNAPGSTNEERFSNASSSANEQPLHNVSGAVNGLQVVQSENVTEIQERGDIELNATSAASVHDSPGKIQILPKEVEDRGDKGHVGKMGSLPTTSGIPVDGPSKGAMEQASSDHLKSATKRKKELEIRWRKESSTSSDSAFQSKQGRYRYSGTQ